jgi:galactose mutarotase-like enzyme
MSGQELRILQSMDFEFSVLPLPRFNDEQDRYYNYGSGGVTMIPANIDDENLVGAAVEALACASGKHLVPAFHDNFIEQGVLRNTESWNNWNRMLKEWAAPEFCSLISPDGQENYPGTVTVRATYTVEGRRLTLKLEGTTDAPTLLNLTNHAYWNLNGTGTVDSHCLQVNATAYTPMVANIPTGYIAPVAGTLYDLQRPACLGERNAADAIAGGYDDNYVLPTTPAVKLAAVLTNGRRTLRVLTDAPGLQVYTGDYLPLKRGGVALEAQNFPDSPHHPHFPSIELRPGELYSRTIVWELD